MKIEFGLTAAEALAASRRIVGELKCDREMELSNLAQLPLVPEEFVGYWLMRSELFERAGQLQEAQKAAQAAVKISPQSKEALQRLIRASLAASDSSLAVFYGIRLVDVHRDDPESYVLRGMAHVAAGDPLPAAADYKTAMELDGKQPEYRS